MFGTPANKTAFTDLTTIMKLGKASTTKVEQVVN